MKRFWVSWWSGNYADEGCTASRFQIWVSGERDRPGSYRTDVSLCAVIDAPDEAVIWHARRRIFLGGTDAHRD